VVAGGLRILAPAKLTVEARPCLVVRYLLIRIWLHPSFSPRLRKGSKEMERREKDGRGSYSGDEAGNNGKKKENPRRGKTNEQNEVGLFWKSGLGRGEE